MSLTPEQIASIRTAAGAPPLQGGGVAPVSLSSRLGLNAPAPVQTKDLGDLTADQFMDSGKKIVSSVTGAADKLAAAKGKGKEGFIQGAAALGEAGLGTAAGAAQGLFAPITATIQRALQLPGVAPALHTAGEAVKQIPGVEPGMEKLSAWAQAHPEAATNLMDAFTVGTTALGGSEAILGKGAAKTTVGEGANALKTVGSDAYEGISKLLSHSKPVEAATEANAPTSALHSFRAKIATGDVPMMGEGNVSKQAQTSAQRLADKGDLIGAGAAREPKPLDMYNEFINQQEKHLGDIKHDPAISMVGERIGKNYDSVVRMRRTVGKDMEEALGNVGGMKTDIGKTFSKISEDLDKEGLIFDAKNSEIISNGTGQTTLTSVDKKMVESYLADLQKLGPNPTIKDLDSFMKRIPNELDVAKAEKNITHVTNGERIVKKSLSDLREAFNPEATGNPALEPYYKARKTYADLSNFLDEGARHLGVKGQTGDYVRDASVAKSAVQSVLNGGKKDWLIKLEGLTGYPALDESTLALQAMKDSGDFKGNSLLQLLTDGAGGVPTSPSGVIDKVLGFLGTKAKGAVAGSTVDRTRAFLKELGDNAKK